jgi:hypothetical protein
VSAPDRLIEDASQPEALRRIVASAEIDGGDANLAVLWNRVQDRTRAGGPRRPRYMMIIIISTLAALGLGVVLGRVRAGLRAEAESAVLDRAAELLANDPERALALLDSNDGATERDTYELLRAEALLRSGETERSREILSGFEDRFPSSRHLLRVRELRARLPP